MNEPMFTIFRYSFELSPFNFAQVAYVLFHRPTKIGLANTCDMIFPYTDVTYDPSLIGFQSQST